MTEEERRMLRALYRAFFMEESDGDEPLLPRLRKVVKSYENVQTFWKIFSRGLIVLVSILMTFTWLPQVAPLLAGIVHMLLEKLGFR